jgi:Ca2+-binding RTX toxin-like protein
MSRLLLATLALTLAGLLGSDAFGARTAALHANGRIAFADVTGIASMNPDGSGQWGVQLFPGDTAPAWSPDGSQLADVTHWAGMAGILVMQPDGSGYHLVTTDPDDRDPAWSPDGAQIAFANQGGIYLVNADGSNRRALTSGYTWASHPAWSPDGTKIAFSAYEHGMYFTTEIYVLDLSSGKASALTTSAIYATEPAWSPDGSTIAFVSNSSIDVVNTDGSDVRQLASSPGSYNDAPAWSPDGTQIAFARNWQIWVMGDDGGNPRQLTNGDGNTAPAWQPLPAGPPGCTLWGTAGNDLLVGTEGNDVICGLSGDDTLIGLGGTDRLIGGDGNDWLAGGLGFDYHDGGAGNDVIDARDGGPDVVYGGPGIDTAYVEGGRLETMIGIERPRIDRDLAAWRPTSADAAEPTNPPVRAVDGRIGDWWNSGGYPSHWIEVDLQRPATIGLVRLISPDLPSGASVLLLGKTNDDDPYRLLHVFDGPTAYLQQLVYAPKKPWRAVRFLRLEVPTANAPMPWVSWPEIEVYAPTVKAQR